jgi:NADH:ubiquinone oxidoreductase subunit F (NADH-binding)
MSVPTMPMRRGEPAATRPTPLRSAPDGLPRLLPAGTPAPQGLREHLARHGFIPYRDARLQLAAELRAAGLTGRGGASFPAYRKLEAVAGSRRRPFVVANGAESEPASSKDASLLWLAPHLVLDGIQLAAEAVGAQEACLYLHDGEGDPIAASLRQALTERWLARIDRVPVQLAAAPPRFLAGQETALVNVLNGGLALPAFTPPRVFERGVGGAPTLVQNVETLAHTALIARYGPAWFRQVGTASEPGSMLATIRHADGTVRIVEAAVGTPLRSLLAADFGTDGADGAAQAILVGGYHGAWLPVRDAAGLTLDNAGLRPAGASVGAGVLAALPARTCGLAEAARVVRYLALESAGQCGPCLNGLPRIADALALLAAPRPDARVRTDIERWAGLVSGRGACHHPDGSVRFVRSALTVFAAELRLHERAMCSAGSRQPFLPLPAGAPARDEDWS